MKSLLEDPKQEGLKMIEASPDSRPVVFQPGAVQELMIEVHSTSSCLWVVSVGFVVFRNQPFLSVDAKILR